ncbi:elongation factor G [Microlunatus soli]|uniref:Ribosomal protection tetracycline resistance protein n=1 Tax=Microlunatus soli TaxID=630515 RepID=A0A1H2AB67_9ACTN|nr:TetM/TetW/TetO/TetS family tetracycline resistance ribosomal protection protein [Microlunatus soli]SDT43221.1 ribosomal protection tetracycline resistance protein [Microlunatus soli]
MSTLNLGILAHVDAGKTSLTERLLHTAGVIDHIGRVDHGDTQTDSLALERQRGITIKSAVTSFVIHRPAAGSPGPLRTEDPITVNLIDTPGHPDFIAEVERVLNVLDGVVLVVSAVEGVQAQTRILTRALRRLRIPMLIFVNKIDRSGARADELLDEIARRLDIAVVGMGTVADAGSRTARSISNSYDDPTFADRLADRLTVADDRLLTRYLEADGLPVEALRSALIEQTARADLHPVFFGSAITGAGVGELMAGIGSLLPSVDGRASAEPSGTVFKVDRGPAGEKIAYLQLASGSLAVRDAPDVSHRDGSSADPAKITAISVFDRGGEQRSERIEAGRIGKLWGLPQVRIGDRIGRPQDRSHGRHRDHYFTPPSLETVVDPVDPADRGRLRTALDRLAEQDPLINVRQDDLRSELSVSLYGEVQKEVIGATLDTDFGVPVTFSETSTICVERPLGIGTAVERIRDPGNPFLATVGLRVEPGPIGTGIRWETATSVHGTMPIAFFSAIEDTVRLTAGQSLYGWRLIDAVITLTHTGYAPRQSHMHQSFNKAMSSTGSDFRELTPLVLMAALRDAGTDVLEPIHRFELEFPTDLLAALYPVLAERRAVPGSPAVGAATTVIEGDIPAAEIHALEQQLPGLTRGEGVLEAAFDRYQPVTGRRPQRRRTDRNPLDRKEYLLRTTRGKGALAS